MKLSPGITALLPVKDGAEFIERSVIAITAMLEEEDELLIVNDGSIDSTEEIANKLAMTDRRISVLRNIGSGIVDALNLGLANAKNPWIARFDVDDEYSETRLALQRSLISDAVVLIFSDYEFRSPEKRFLGNIPSAIDSDAIKLSLISSQRTPHPCSMFNRMDAIRLGGYRKEDFPAEDLSLWLRLAYIGQMASSAENLLYYRLSKSSVTATRRDESLKKKRELILQYKIPNEAVNSVINSWKALFDFYDSVSFSSERKILLTIDLFRYSKYFNLDWSQRRKLVAITFGLMTSPRNYQSLFRLFQQQKSRKTFRKIDK